MDIFIVVSVHNDIVMELEGHMGECRLDIKEKWKKERKEFVS